MKKMIVFSAALSLLLVLSGCGAAETFASAPQEVMLTPDITPLAAIPADTEATIPVSTESPAPTQAPARNRLTSAQAKAIALTHAGIAEDAIRFLRVEFDYDDGVPRYEVEFITDGWEYEYDIHAETGAILSFEKDR